MQRNQKRDFVPVLVGAGSMFLLLLLIGILDKWKYLDPVLDFLHVPK